MTERRIFRTMDVYLASYLRLRGLEPTLELNNGKVLFAFAADDEFYRLSNLFNSGDPVSVTDYVASVKALRGQMLTLRGPRV